VALLNYTLDSGHVSWSPTTKLGDLRAGVGSTSLRGVMQPTPPLIHVAHMHRQKSGLRSFCRLAGTASRGCEFGASRPSPAGFKAASACRAKEGKWAALGAASSNTRGNG
jgi:hypothetical protein